MSTQKSTICLLLFFWLVGSLLALPNISRAMSQLSDTVSTSWPSYPSNHTIILKVHDHIPPGSQIVITPETTDFSVLAGFDYQAFDLATSSSKLGPYTDRDLGATSTAMEDGVAIAVSGAGTSTLNQITITLNSSTGINSNEFIRLEIGANALYGTTSLDQILNATTTGSQLIKIEILDSNGQLIDQGEVVIVMVNPVLMTNSQAKVRSNGQPTGVLQYGTTQTLMNLTTNYYADCRYSMASGTLYADMANDFAFTGVYYHSVIISGLVDGQFYTYYIRCRDAYNVDDTTDYIIQFEISGAEGEGGDESGDPGSGGSGGGSGGGLGSDIGPGLGEYLPYPPEPGLPGVVLTGWAFPDSEVTILKDGIEQGKALTNSQAEFGAFLEELNQGIYTFSLWGADPAARKSSIYSTTFWIDEGTQTTVSDIILSPSIALADTEFNSNETIEVFGYSVPGETVEAWLYAKGETNLNEENAEIKEVIVRSDGKWNIYFNTTGMDNGQYQVKAKTKIELRGESGFSQALNLAIGGAVEQEICVGADLNGDGLVNLTDFSILLYYWSTDDDCADQNDDGTVDLTDFSIMMFYWTG